MVPAAAAAVAVFINGCQVLLPAPAFQRGDTVMVPVKGVFDRLGARVDWSPGSKQVVVTATETSLVLTIGSGRAELNGQPIVLQQAPELVEGVTMVPLRLVAEALGADIAWDQPRRRVYLQTEPTGPPSPATISSLIAEPHAWSGRLVTVSGEYLGWQPSPFSAGTRNGTPVSRRDWVLRDASGEIYCRGDTGVPAPFPLLPYSGAGRRVVVAGVVKLALGGFPFLEPREVAAVPPPEGLVCSVTTSRRAYVEGEALTIRLTVGNPFPTAVEVACRPGPEYDLVIRDREGKERWRLSAASPVGPAPATVALQPGEMRQLEEVWDSSGSGVPPLPPGRYTVEGEWGGAVRSYPHLVAVAPSRQ